MSATGREGEEMTFRLPQSSIKDGVVARVGQLVLPSRKPMATPNFITLSSRGTVPHMTPDVIGMYTSIGGVYMGLEDFVEVSPKRVSPALFNAPSGPTARRLHTYTATSPSIITIMGARRHPAVLAPMGNGQKHISIFTSTGFQNLDCDRYCKAIEKTRPDIVIPMADLTFGSGVRNSKRQLRMVERSEEWLEDFFRRFKSEEDPETPDVHVFAPLLTAEHPLQWSYLKTLSQEYAPDLSGLAIYDVDILPELESHNTLTSLPRLSMDTPSSPHQILRQIQLGVDMFAIPFLNGCSDAGIAFSFAFPPPSTTSDLPDESNPLLSLGIDMWDLEHERSLLPLAEGCECYACTKHHRAYVRHLLNAKEMLGWTLLQIHNHHITSHFFTGVRAAIADGSFERVCAAFGRIYETELPKGTGQRPRARGYHFKSEAHNPKINPPPWERFEGAGEVIEDGKLATQVAGLAVGDPSAAP